VTHTKTLVKPLLTIAIPTWNRSNYLQQNLRQLKTEIDTVGHDLVEVVVSDNCSSDATYDVVQDFQKSGLDIRYIRNAENIGWARNFCQCVELSSGKYMLLFGDDDVLCSGALSLLIKYIKTGQYGVICLRPYGYNNDYKKEHPGGKGKIYKFDDSNAYLLKISQYFTLTSALVINRTALKNIDSREFIHTNLAIFHLVIRAALISPNNLYIKRFLVASKRQNSSSYEYHTVFVGEFWKIIDAHIIHGLTLNTVRSLEYWRLFSYYPFYMLDLRLSNRGDLEGTYQALKERFRKYVLFWLWIAPILRLPRPMAILWGTLTMIVGRLAQGDFHRGITFFLNKFF